MLADAYPLDLDSHGDLQPDCSADWPVTGPRQFTGFTRFIDTAISQNVRLQGCVNKTCKNCDNCCCTSSRLVAPAKKNWKGEKGTTLFVTLQHCIKSVND
jgi:hypothetical protein